ncbi:zinc finger CCCH domain-containing protein 14 isoform X2 [Scaptodrosophila lebanonensis]|uniref:Zinc finger CCCH domain-containing protein 14 n=1 Tax=Drosophila lebanonensis TaxID=7225 RepID=A0A6J2TJP9_DROLE|nr:zinc finger CCCH domain-containing protein 14 isoform X2 [Scaptodrosophila lebanonensis]
MDCNLGSEIGQKMRSAVKAKLLELGTGGSAGFIDDELPDYVMVMVANKRTKQQMNAELNLFLGDQTDLFVTWLHEVLQKLQEVTLPASSASKKRKSEKAKEKKVGKKEKRGHRKSGDDAQLYPISNEPATSDGVPVINSITDVFAEELLEKAKKTLDVDTDLKDEILQKKKKRKSCDEQLHHMAGASEEGSTKQDFDIPTMSEISSTTAASKDNTDGAISSGNREKDLAELAEIQRKIYAAKKHLRKIGELEADEEIDDDEDEDFINLNEQEESVGNDDEESQKSTQETTRKVRSPIIFKKRAKTPEPAATSKEQVPTTRDKEVERQPEHKPREQTEKTSEERNERRPVHERLGSKPQPLERVQRVQKQLYVPAHRRRTEQEAERQRSRERIQRERERSRERRNSRERERQDSLRESARNRRSSPLPPPKDKVVQRSLSSENTIVKQRVVSRVIVAPNKTPEPSDDEDLLEKPVNSVIKIKPRPQVSPRRQACKNLLLRAVADAQRSTILAKPSPTSASKKDNDEPVLISATLGKRKATERCTNPTNYREVERERAKRSAPNNELFRRTTRELVVNVLQHDKRSRGREREHIKAKLVEEEYVPTLGRDKYSADLEPYVPQIIDPTDIDMHLTSNDESSIVGAGPKTQFVVTLNGEKSLGPYRKRSSASRKRTPSPTTPQVSSSSAAHNSTEPSSTTSLGGNSRRRKPDGKSRERNSSHSPTLSNTPPPLISRSLNRSEVLRQPTEIKKIIIKSDTDEEDEPSLQSNKGNGSPRKRSVTKRLGSSVVATSSSLLTVAATAANGYNKSKTKQEERSTTPPLPPKKLADKRSASKEEFLTAAEPALPQKNKHTPIRFTLKNDEELVPQKKRRSDSQEERDKPVRDTSTERRKISIRTAEDRKYDNLPALSAVSVDSTVLKVSKPKERCIYHPNCTKQFCEYYHPTAPCKSFPNCKFADKCMYSHPKCKFDMACMSVDCNYAHSGPRDLSHVQLTAPPLSSHVIPVQNYKSISAPITTTTATTMCKYYPNCTNLGCTFYHPKPCRYGKNCINKLECVFYHPEMQSKFKWVASLG